MQRLTLGGYLERYVKSLSQNKTTGIRKLAYEAVVNHRLREPLFLFALYAGKVDLLLEASKDNNLYTHYSDLADRYSWSSMLTALETGDNALDIGYHKTYNSYVCRRDMPQTNNRSKALMHSKIKRLQESKNITNYRIYTDLNLNPDNANAYLKTGDVTKVSRDVARKIVLYMDRQ